MACKVKCKMASNSTSTFDDGELARGGRYAAENPANMSYSDFFDDDDDDGAGYLEVIERNEDVLLMKRALTNEKVAPEILPFQERLVRDLKDQLDNQQAVIDETPTNPDEAFASGLYQMEIDRINFMLASYLRTRLFKIQKHVLAILGDEELHSRLSLHEFKFAEKYLDVLRGHFVNRVLGELPEEYSSFTTQYEGDGDGAIVHDMMPTPDMDKFVFSNVQKDVGSEVVVDDAGTERHVLNQGNLFVARYKCVKGLVDDGSITLF